MKRKIFTSLLAVVIACSALFAFPVTQASDSTTMPLTYSDGDTLFVDQMFLGAWCEPEGTEEQVSLFAECGYNVVYMKEEQRYDGSMLYHNLDLYDKYGIKAMLGMSSGRKGGISWRAAKESLDHSAVLGLCSCDEPLGTGDRKYKDNGEVNYQFDCALSSEKSQETNWQRVYEKHPYSTVWDFLYYDGMTFLYGRDETQFYLEGITNENLTDGVKVVPATPKSVSANNPGAYKVGTNSDTYKNKVGEKASDTFNRVFTSVIANKATDGAFGYATMKSYCESVFAGKHDVRISSDDTMPVPVEDRFLEIDIYPYSVNKRTGEFEIALEYLSKLMEYRYYIDAYDVTMTNVYYQNWFDDALMPYVDEATLTQQFYTIMTYGIKGLTVWYYNMYWSDYQTSNNVSIDEFCERTDLWYYNEAAFNEIEALDNVYLKFCGADNWDGIVTINGSENSTGAEGMFAQLPYNRAMPNYTFGRATDTYDVFDFPGSTLTPAEAKVFAESYVDKHHYTPENLPSFIESVTATGDATIGCMRDADGNRGYVITNQNFVFDRVENDITIDFGSATKAMLWNAGQYELVDLTNGVLDLHLGVGDGAFVIPLA